MSDTDESSVLVALGIDPETDYPIPDDVWDTLVHNAVDPDTPASDASVVPIMDDHGTVPDTADEALLVHHDAHADSHSLDHPGGDGSDHFDAGDHETIADHDADSHSDPGTHHPEHVDHEDDPGHPDPGAHGSDWHI